MSRRRGDELPCPIDGCVATRPVEHAMCAPHWRMVPADLKRAVNRAWRDRLRSGGRTARMVHLQALEDAEAAVEGREPRHLFGDVA